MQLPPHLWLVPLLLLRVRADPDQHDVLCEPRSFVPYLSIPGQAVLTVLVDGHTGENCTIPVAVGLEQMAAIAWAVSEANAVSLVPGINIGLEVFDTCSNVVVTQKAALSALSEADCDGHFSIGVLSSYRTAQTIHALLDALDIESFGKYLPEPKTLGPTALAAVQTLKALNVTHTAVVAHSAAALRVFSALAKKMDICVTWQDVMDLNDESFVDIEVGYPSQGGSAVILGPWTLIKEHLEGIQSNSNFTSLSWLLAPTDLPWEVVSEEATYEGLPPNTLIAAASAEAALRLDSLVNQETLEALGPGTLAAEAHLAELKRAALVVLEAVSRLREALLEDCGQFSMCAQLKPLARHNFSQDAALAPTALEPPRNAKSGHAEANFKIGKVELSTNCVETVGDLLPGGQLQTDNGTIDLLDDWAKGGCEKDCVCLNEVYRPTVWSLIRWNGEIWVAVVTSVAGVGVALSFAVAVFIITRMCKGDVLEGNPTFSFILLFGVIFTYVAVLPYCGSGPRLLCVIRELGTCLGYALLLSVMLARAIMLTTTDEQGFMSHVSGYLQAALWFFIVAVQVGLTAQFLIFNQSELLSMPSSEAEGNVVCHQHRGSFLLLLGYDFLLMLMLVLISPLVARSKRNYREGFFFCLASWMCATCWIFWVTGFVILDEPWRPMVIAVGQVACASVVLSAVFIPRTYLIVSSVTRARIASAIPCAAAAYSSSTNILDIQYRSSQALYDSVHNVHHVHQGGHYVEDEVPAAPPLPKSPQYAAAGVSNPNYYSEQPRGNQSAASTLKAGRSYASPRMVRSPSPENTYARYDSPPSPLKVTRF
ncbi:uncharacterized protein LOC132204606 isoform X2 [Neocloeon triangulifer]|uniref:uncharacterized protein LOC132204606 isoform X2 n=1 Tax=Neocloeon triangulifer TaxID=2078957 RepID=UPI00286F6DC3|nr:uncharacterized protein LOC132204606 isoform X2 [Neocloeon triangulifer]